MAATVTIGGVSYIMVEDQHDLTTALQERQRFKCDIIDYSGTAHFTKGQSVTISDPVLGLFYTGVLNDDKEVPLYPSGAIVHTIDCIDFGQYITGKRTFTGTYPTPAKAAKIAIDQVSSVLGPEGINQNYANRFETTANDFNQGTNTNTVGTLNVGDGDLELAPSGMTVTYNETAAPIVTTNSATSAIKLTTTMTSTGLTLPATYVKIWQGSYTLVSDDTLWYDEYIDPSSPQATMAVDILFSDGSYFSQRNYPGVIFTSPVPPDGLDVQGFSPGPAVDITGFGNVGWYTRAFRLASEVYANLSVVAVFVACGGTSAGNYKGYFRNISIGPSTNRSTTHLSIFTTSLNINPPIQQRNYGYANTMVSVVPTYDLYTSTAPNYGAKQLYTTSPIPVSAVKFLRTSLISWQALTPTGTTITVKYSLDGGNSYTICANNAPLPNIPAGFDLTGKSILLLYEFYTLQGGSVELAPVLQSLTLTLYTSYSATKNDLFYSATTQAAWNAGTLTNTTANANNELQLSGRVKQVAWSSLSGESGSANSLYYSYPSSDTFTTAGTVNRTFRVNNIAFNGGEAHVRFNDMPQYQNFITEIDTNLNIDNAQNCLLYRTTGWQYQNNTWGYIVCLSTDGYIVFGYGSNTSSGSGSFTQLAKPGPYTFSKDWHRIKAVVNGSNHQIYVDDVLYINLNDSTYTSAGYFGVRVYDYAPTPTTATPYPAFYFANFGAIQAYTGNWVSPGTAMSSANTYQSSLITWRDKSASYNALTNTTTLVEASYDNGSTWQTCTNGTALPNLTKGQSLSGKTLKIRVTFTTSTATSLTAIDNLNVYLVGGYNSSGTRSTAPIGNDTSITRTVGSGWGLAFDGQTWIQVGTGATSVSGGELQIANTTGDVHMQLGTRTGTDMDETDRISISTATMSAGMELRYQDANNYYRLAITSTGLTIVKMLSGVSTNLASVAVSYATNTFYRMRFRVIGSSPASLYGKVWLDGTAEPSNWTITASN